MIDYHAWSPNYTVIEEREIRGIVLHDTEGSFESAIAWFRRAGTASAHYVIAKSGTLVQCVDERHAAWHVRAADRWRPTWLDPVPPGTGRVSDVNACTIGIELELLASDPDGAYSEVQLSRLNVLVQDIMQRYGLTRDRVVRHGDLQRDRSDPRGLFIQDVFPDDKEAKIQGALAYLQSGGVSVNPETALIRAAIAAILSGCGRGHALTDEYPVTINNKTYVRQDFSAGIALYDPESGKVLWTSCVYALHRAASLLAEELSRTRPRKSKVREALVILQTPVVD